MNEHKTKLTELHSECGASEPYALQVTDDSMEGEFPKDCIVIIDPTKNCKNGDFVFAEYDGVRWFRKYEERKGGKYLIALNDLFIWLCPRASIDFVLLSTSKPPTGTS